MGPHVSIIIVNYNVRHFIKRCIESVYRSVVDGLQYEIYVVDNASIDGSVEMIRAEFPNVHLIANTDNVGFSKANNQAIRLSKAEYSLILNPDTVLQEDTLQVCYDYMDANNDVGALGVKMIDGSGEFLPESKRALPSIWNSISKLSGLSSLFPTTDLLNGYPLGHLDKDKRHAIEVLCGAFMFVSKSAIDKVGMFDEIFFMYGEDIDWSRRIIEGGFEIHYIPDTTIIHYKGESTKKASLSYVKTFYGAMSLYVEKHYSGSTGKWLSKLLKIGISFRAGLSAIKRIISQSIRPVLDTILIGSVLFLFAQVWESYYFNDSQYYKTLILLWSVSIYAMLWSLVMWFVGYYQKTSFQKRIVGVSTGLLIILAGYALLPEAYRTSRVLILSGGVISLVVTSLSALALSRGRKKGKKKNTLIVASEKNGSAIITALEKANVQSHVLGMVNPSKDVGSDLKYLNNITNLGPLCKVLKADEVIFSGEDMTMKEIMKQMMLLDTSLSYKIAGDDSLSILGSMSKNTTGELYSINIKYNLEEEYFKHIKRSFDIISSLLLLVIFPIILLINKLRLLGLLKNIFFVLFGRRTWVGYSGDRDDYQNLPELRSGILTHHNEEDAHKANTYYAKDYSVWLDLELLFKSLGSIS